jgi:hypothetical protein
MSKGGGRTRTITQTTAAPAYAQPYLEYGLSQARQLYESPTPEYYPESTVVGFSPQTQAALAGLEAYAQGPQPIVEATQQAVMQNLMGTNPLQAAAFRPVVEQVEAQAAKAGRYGSGYQQAALAQALAPAALQAQQAAIAQAPAAFQFGQAPSQLMAQVGAAQEAQQQAQLQADIDRFMFEQMRPQQKLAEYLTSVRGGTVGSQQVTPVYRNPALGFLSGGLAGGQLAGTLSEAGALGSINPLALMGAGAFFGSRG